MQKHKIITIAIVLFYVIFLAASIFIVKSGKELEGYNEAEGVVLEFYKSSGSCGECSDAAQPLYPLKTSPDYSETVTFRDYKVDNQEFKANFERMKSFDLNDYPSYVIYNSSDKIIYTSFYYIKSVTTSEYIGNILNQYLSGNVSNITVEEKTDGVVIDFFGSEIVLSDLSLPVLTILLGGMDSINPCSFFVLLFLLSLLLYTKSRKKMMLIGGIFIFFSGFIYFLLMTAILNFILLVEQQMLISIIAGCFAVFFGFLNIKDYFYFNKGLSASIPDSKKPKLFKQMRNLVKLSSLPSIIFGTVVLAISANTVELLCSFNLPVIYTTILTRYNLSAFEYHLYIFFYNIVYIIPLLIIVSIMVVSLGKWKLSEFQGRILKLFSGIMIFSLGEFLLLEPMMLENILITLGILLASIILTFVIYVITKRYEIKEKLIEND